MSRKVVAAIKELVEPILEVKKFELVDIEYVKKNNQWFLRVFIEKEGGIDIDETALVSEELSKKMDYVQPNPFADVDFLEVSSPGVERLLKNDCDYKAALGKYVHLSLYQAIDGIKVLEGNLFNFNLQTLTLNVLIKTSKKRVIIERKNIAKACLAIKF
ncbi:MAG: ribosome maturation factor RimP [Lactobacillales bacterium]|jgi:ribosome maturation factor RimP|nr:ribosome maturation factor RimP [Lactobacillales bacterium]